MYNMLYTIFRIFFVIPTDFYHRGQQRDTKTTAGRIRNAAVVNDSE